MGKRGTGCGQLYDAECPRRSRHSPRREARQRPSMPPNERRQCDRRRSGSSSSLRRKTSKRRDVVGYTRSVYRVSSPPRLSAQDSFRNNGANYLMMRLKLEATRIARVVADPRRELAFRARSIVLLCISFLDEWRTQPSSLSNRVAPRLCYSSVIAWFDRADFNPQAAQPRVMQYPFPEEIFINLSICSTAAVTTCLTHLPRQSTWRALGALGLRMTPWNVAERTQRERPIAPVPMSTLGSRNAADGGKQDVHAAKS